MQSDQNNTIEHKYIYLIYENRFRETQQSIFTLKIQNKTQIPDEDMVMFQLYCGDAKDCQEIIFQIFNNKYILMNEYGNNYFKGSSIEMINDINFYVLRPIQKRKLAKLCTDDNIINMKLLLFKKKTQILKDIKANPDIMNEKLEELKNYSTDLLNGIIELNELYV